MKNNIEYNYNININEIRQVEKKYKFELDGYQYVFTPIPDINIDVREIQKFGEILNKIMVPCHQFVYNFNKQIITIVDSIQYVLLRCFVKIDQKVTYDEILKTNKITIPEDNEKILKKFNKSNWDELWSEKIDYFEYQISQFGKKHPLIRESFSYFVGITENLISLLRNNNSKLKKNIIMSIGHKRIAKNMTLYDYYNPFEIIIDYNNRDVAEYFKTCFFNNEEGVEEQVINYLRNLTNLNDETNSILFFVRMLFPSHYFDKFQKIVLDDENEETLNYILEKINNFEKMIKNVYLNVSPYINYEIFWLKK